MEQTIDPTTLTTISLLVVVAVLTLVVTLRVVPTLERIANRLRDTEVAVRGIQYDMPSREKPDKSDDTDWAEKYQHLALTIAAVIAADHQPPTTYNDAASLGYRDGAKAVVTELRDALTPSEGA